jgi:hypothetical protein
MTVLGIDRFQIAIPTGGEEKARGFHINLPGFHEISKPPELT